jgi:gluconokinase
MISKIRLQLQGLLFLDYHQNLGLGFDGRCCRFLKIEYQELVQQVKQNDVDDITLLHWCFNNGHHPNDEEILIWNDFMSKRGWRDDSHTALLKYKEDNNLSHVPQIETLFDFYEYDEGRKSST